MISANKSGANLSGFSATESVYNIPNIDPRYQVANSQYSNLPENAAQFNTTSVFYDPSRPISPGNTPEGTTESQPGTTRPLWERIIFDPWNLFSNDAQESQEQAKDSVATSTNETFAIGAIILVFGTVVAWRALK